MCSVTHYLLTPLPCEPDGAACINSATTVQTFYPVIMPMIIFRLFAQKHIIGGLTSSVVKG